MYREEHFYFGQGDEGSITFPRLLKLLTIAFHDLVPGS